MVLKLKLKLQLIKLTDKQQLKILKEHLEESNKLDIKEKEELEDKSGNTVPKTLTDKDKFQKIYEKIKKIF